jgi:hypothetical protein
MLRTNLSTRPFYDERAVRIAIAGAVLVTLALTVFNAFAILSLNRGNSAVVAQADASEAKATALRNQAKATEQTLNRQELDAVQAAAREANLLIDRRAFSWTDLFNRFEETLPPDVRILAVAPQVDADGRMMVAMTTIARRFQALDNFADHLQDSGAFTEVISRQDEHLEDGSFRAVLQGYYTPTPREQAAVSSSSASDSTDASGKQSGADARPATRPATGRPTGERR